MNDKALLRRKIEATKFAAWELHLFLDSHPNNCEAIKRLEKFNAEIKAMTAEYEKKYGTLTPNSRDTNRYEWINSPWPWETEESNNVDV